MDQEIDLIRAQLTDLADELIGGRQPSQPFGTYLACSDEPSAELARSVERAVFLETFGDTAELLEAEYRPYESASVFFIVLDHRRRVPAGMMRIIVPSRAGFKSLDDVARVWNQPVHNVLGRVSSGWDLERLWDFATLAVSPDYRGEAALGLVTQALVQSLTMLGQHCGARRFVAILDAPVLRMLQWRLGRPFEQFPGLDIRPYLGSAASAAVWGDVNGWRARLSTTDPILHEVFFAGHGLEPVLSTPEWHDAADRVREVSRRSSVGHG